MSGNGDKTPEYRGPGEPGIPSHYWSEDQIEEIYNPLQNRPTISRQESGSRGLFEDEPHSRNLFEDDDSSSGETIEFVNSAWQE